MRRAVLVVKGEEPKVVVLNGDSYDEYANVLRGALSDNEKALSDVESVESFGSGIEYVLGYVESYSALHPYERNRQWYGPALFAEYNSEGYGVDMSDENIDKLMDMFSLENKISSPSSYVNEFLDKYAKSEMHNITIGHNHGILDTMDAADYLRKATEPEDVAIVEQMLKEIEAMAQLGVHNIEELVMDYLKEVNKFLFSENIKRQNQFEIFEF